MAGQIGVLLPVIENASAGTVIRDSVKLAEAARHGVPVDECCRNCLGYRDYDSLAQEVIAQKSTRLIPEAAHPGMEEVSLREESLLEQLRLPSAPIAASKGMVFTLEAAGAQTLQIAGDFNLWRPEGTELQCRKGMWRTVVPLSPGRHRYHHIVDGCWQPDPLNPEVERTPFGGYNSVSIVGDPERKAQ